MHGDLFRRVLVLNKSWIAINTCSVKKALEDMNSSKSPKKALKIEYQRNADGSFDYKSPIEILPLNFEEWITIMPREFDSGSIRTSQLEIRIPTVVICDKYNKIPLKKFRANKRAMFVRYGGRDYYTGEELSLKTATIDHVIPKSRGGKNGWENCALTSAKINRLKSDMPLEEFLKQTGYKPQYKLSEPAPSPMSVTIQEDYSPDWNIFLIHKK